MISEFQDLSDKIARLAELSQSLRRENAELRKSNKWLHEQNVAFLARLDEAQHRIRALLAQLPGEDDAATRAEANE